jgi:hypothetical protein
MSMIKVIQPQSQNFSDPVASLIKISSRGIIGNDRADLVKRAGAEFVSKLDNVKFASDEVPIHLIAIGATEAYGANRNGDGFTDSCCRNYHPTFKKHAKFYRDHKNKQPEISYGTVKESAYHEPMKRIELICALNSTKEAAERNGGLVADKEIEKLASGKDIPVSMACTVAYDVCSSCGNKAKTRADYCDSIENGGHCKAGGLKHNIGKVLDDGHILHADNPHPKFFDISHVFRPADRIAYVSGQLQKAAAAGVCISGAELADQLGVTAPIDVLIDRANIRDSIGRQIIALEKLAAADRALEHVTGDHWHHIKLASAARAPLPHPQERTKIAEVFKAAADVGVIFPLREFLGMVTRQADTSFVEKVAAELPGVFADLADDPAVFERLENNPYTPAISASAATQMWAVKVAADYSVLPQDTQRRAFRAALQNVVLDGFVPRVKSAKVESNSAAVTLAKQYALYKVAAYAAFCENFGDTALTAAQCIMQN